MEHHRPTATAWHTQHASAGIPQASASLPLPQTGAKVCLALNDKTPAEVLAMARTHKLSMTDNPNFPDPLPSREAFARQTDELASIMAELASKRLEMIALTSRKDQVLARMNAALTQRGQYVEIASNGNSGIIASSGFPVRRERKAIGALTWPTELTVRVTQFRGALAIRWKSMKHARSYVLEITSDDPNTTPEPRWTNAYVGGRASCQIRDLTPGTTYYFRLATIGGAEGQSPWSPIVSRLCA